MRNTNLLHASCLDRSMSIHSKYKGQIVGETQSLLLRFGRKVATEAKARSGDGGDRIRDSLGDCRGKRRAILTDEEHDTPRQTRVAVIALFGNRASVIGEVLRRKMRIYLIEGFYIP